MSETNVPKNPNSESFAKLAEALAKAQSKIVPPVKNRHVDFQPVGKARVKYSYADLADVIEAVKVPLSDNGLSIIHKLEYSEGHYGLRTALLHTSGEYISSWYPLPDPQKQQIRAQEFGSALTYARRYSLSALVGIASDQDDDGASAPPTNPPDKIPKPPSNPPTGAPARHLKPVNNQVNTQGPSNVDKARDSVDNFPDYENQSQQLDSAADYIDKNLHEDEPPTLIDQLFQLVEELKIPHTEMPEIIKRATGQKLRSTQLDETQLKSVLKYIQLSK